jgi:ubiquinone/menaquinone biosynthesis C-methylase UbiE
MSRKPAASEAERRQRALLKALGSPARALNVADAGCGAGEGCRLWARQGHQVYGADTSAAAIAHARARARAEGLEILLDVAAAGALPWPDRSMDVCLAGGALGHAPDWRRCLAESLRVLRPGGALYISGADYRSDRSLLRRELARHGARAVDRSELAMPWPLGAPWHWLARALMPAAGRHAAARAGAPRRARRRPVRTGDAMAALRAAALAGARAGAGPGAAGVQA